MGRKPRKVEAARQAAYIKSRVLGMSKEDSKELAGYAPTTSTFDIEKHVKNFRAGLVEAAAKLGITPHSIMENLKDAVELARTDGAREKDISSMVKAIQAQGHLLGALGNVGKAAPLVALQVNNGIQGKTELSAASSEQVADHLGKLEERIAELRRIEESLKAALGDGENRGFHERNPGYEDPFAST